MPLTRDALVEVALRDGARPFDQPLDGHRDAASDVEADPGGREQHDHRGEAERDRVRGLDRLPLHLQANVLVERTADVLAALRDAVRDVGIDHDDRHRAVVHHDGSGGTDHVRLADGVHDRGFRSLCHATHEVRPRREPDARGQLATPAARDRLAVREHLDDVELVFGAALIEEPLERLAPLGRQQAFGAQPSGKAAREPERGLAESAVVRLRDLPRAGERVLHLLVEPPLDRVADEHQRHEEEQRRGQQRDPDERADEAGAQVRADDAAPALEDQLHDVPADQEHEQDQQDQVQVDEHDEHRIGAHGARAGGLREMELEDGEEHDRHRGRDDDQPFQTAPARLGRGRLRRRRVGRAGHEFAR